MPPTPCPYLRPVNSEVPTMSTTQPRPPVSVYAEMTPNPATMRFVSSRMLVHDGRLLEFRAPEEPVGVSPLAEKVFNLPFVTGVFISSNFVTVTKNNAVTWDLVQLELREYIQEYLNTDGRVVYDDAPAMALADANERATYAQKLYGKAWVDMVGVLEKGEDVIRNSSEAVSDSLILTEQSLKLAEKNRVAIDNVSDSWTGLTVSIGAKALPMVNTLLVAVQKNIDAGLSWRDVVGPVALFDTIKSLVDANKELNPVLDSGTQSYTAWAKAVENAVTSTDTLSVVLEEIAVDYSGILGMTGKISDAQMSFGDKVTEVNNDITLSEDERIAKLLDLQTQYDQTTTKIISDNLLQKLSIDGLTQTEFEKAIAFQEATGLITPLAATQALAFNQITDAAAAGQISVEGLRNAMALLQNKSVTLSVTQITRMVRLDDLSNWADSRQGFASGTDGWKTVPGGYPNDSFPIGLTSGEKFAVIPANGAGTGSGGVGGAASSIVVNLSMNSVVSMADRESMKRLTPFIIDGIREAQAQGYIK